MLSLLVMAGLAGCGDTSKPVGTVGHIQGFGGLVAADEPRAVVSARDILSAGGTAADAAVAMYFTMAVTQPSTASLGGGGVCVVFDKEKKRTEVLDFLATPSGVAARTPTPNAVPGNVRGFYALHAKYGKLRWEQLLADAERLARQGTPVSRALISDLNMAAPLLARDPLARSIFLKADGSIPSEGEQFQQHDLAATIARVRRSPGEFYAGALGRELVQSVTAIGGTLSIEDLRDFRPQNRDALTVKIGSQTAYFAPPPAVAGATAAQIVGQLTDRWGAASADLRPYLLAEAAGHAFADRTRWMQPHGWSNDAGGDLVSSARLTALAQGLDGGRHQAVQAPKPVDAIPAASLVALDSYGSAVACNVTTYGLFGNGRVAPGTGIVMAGVPGLTSGPPAVGPVLVVNANSNELRFAGAASGGVSAATALAQVVLDNQVAGVKLDQAEAAGRVHYSGNPDIAFAESGANPSALQSHGFEVKTTPMPSRVQALSCSGGLPSFSRCQVAADPRGFGLTATVGKD